MCKHLLLFLFLLALGASTALAAGPSSGPVDLVQQVQKKYQQLHSLEFRFTQFTRTGGRTKEGSGSAVFYRLQGTAAGKGRSIMRWNYAQPTEQTILNDGRELSIYTPQDRQLVISPVQDLESDLTYAIFTGARNLLDGFEPARADRSFALNDPPQDAVAVLLTPKQPHSQVKRVQLWLASDHTIHRLLMEDHFGALTELTFTAVRINSLAAGDARQAEKLLELKIPDGTEVIRQ